MADASRASRDIGADATSISVTSCSCIACSTECVIALVLLYPLVSSAGRIIGTPVLDLEPGAARLGGLSSKGVWAARGARQRNHAPVLGRVALQIVRAATFDPPAGGPHLRDKRLPVLLRMLRTGRISVRETLWMPWGGLWIRLLRLAHTDTLVPPERLTRCTRPHLVSRSRLDILRKERPSYPLGRFLCNRAFSTERRTEAGRTRLFVLRRITLDGLRAEPRSRASPLPWRADPRSRAQAQECIPAPCGRSRPERYQCDRMSAGAATECPRLKLTPLPLPASPASLGRTLATRSRGFAKPS